MIGARGRRAGGALAVAVVTVITIAVAALPDNGVTVATSSTPRAVMRLIDHATPCTARDLKTTLLGSRVLDDQLIYALGFTNTISAPCHIYGWPKVRLLDRAGRTVSRAATRAYDDPEGKTWPQAMIMEPGTRVRFRLSFSLPPVNGRACKPVAYLQVYTPAGTHQMRVAIHSHPSPCLPSGVATAVTAVAPTSSA